MCRCLCMHFLAVFLHFSACRGLLGDAFVRLAAVLVFRGVGVLSEGQAYFWEGWHKRDDNINHDKHVGRRHFYPLTDGAKRKCLDRQSCRPDSGGKKRIPTFWEQPNHVVKKVYFPTCMLFFSDERLHFPRVLWSSWGRVGATGRNVGVSSGVGVILQGKACFFGG